jgi:hypothetical protein
MPYYSTSAPARTAGRAGASPGGCRGCGGGCCGGCGCGCNACRGLSTLERPRYFSGQLLTEDEMRSEQDYLMAKNRLHNRYLHGWGIVCGLQLTCDDCSGFVAVHSGYALDPCGNDVVVPCLQHYDILKAIRECKESARRQSNCDPYGQTQTTCEDETEHWCVSVRYDETQRRPATALRQTAMSSGCGCSSGSAPSGGCGCGGSTAKARPASSRCGCGGSSGPGSVSYGGASHGTATGTTAAPKASVTYPSTSNLLLGACEPTRTVEGYAFSVRKSDGHCPDPGGALQNTFVGRIAACFTGLLQLAKTRMQAGDRVVVASAFAGTSSIAHMSAADQYAALCRLREFTLDVLDSDAFGLTCGLPCAGYDIVIPKPLENQDENGQDYADRSSEALRGMISLLVEHLRQCICQALEPPCGPDPCDDLVPLGCVTISKDDIVSVCSLSGRHYAGSFPALAYWISLGPLIAAALCRLCCAPLYGRRARRNALFAMLDSVDPSGSLRKTAGAQGFAAPRYYATQVRRVWHGFKFSQLLKKIPQPENGINVAQFLDQTPTGAQSALQNAGVEAERIEVEDADSAPTVGLLAVPPLVRPGDHVSLYEHEGQILGYTVTHGGGNQ